MAEHETDDDISRSIGPHVIVYGPPGRQLAYSTACTWDERALQVGYCRRRYGSGADVHAVPADQFRGDA